MKVLILFSDTGGGHRAASVAVISALESLDADVEISMRDGLVDGGPWPLNKSPAIYTWAMKWCRWAWAFFFHLWNGPFRAKVMADLGYPRIAGKLRKLIAEEDADVVVSTHPLLTRTIARCLKKIESQSGKKRPPFGIVVTDLVTGHWSWYDDGADRIFVPTPEAFERVERGGVSRKKLVMTGQAVHPKCGRATSRRAELRTGYGWDEPTVLIVGGGDGMGAIARHARAIDDARLDARLVVICGRNAKLKAELDAHPWQGKTEVLGFVHNLHELMAAADILVSKSGPGSIMEGCVAGLPILLYDYLPGQEVGNVQLVKSRGIGYYTPSSAEIVRHLRAWIEDPSALQQAAEASRAYAIPDSATRIAQGILEMVPGRGTRDQSESAARTESSC